MPHKYIMIDRRNFIGQAYIYADSPKLRGKALFEPILCDWWYCFLSICVGVYHPKRSPRSASSSWGAGGASSFFLGYYFLASFLGSSFLTFLSAALPADGALLPSLPCPSAMSWWIVFPLSAVMTWLISASEACDWTLPRRVFKSAAAELNLMYWYPSCLRGRGERMRLSTSFVAVVN